MAETKSGMTVRTKLVLAVVFLVIISVSVGGLAYYGFRVSNGAMEELTRQAMPVLALIDDTKSQLAAARRYESEFFLLSSLPVRNEATRKKQGESYGKLMEQYSNVGKNIASLRNSPVVAETKESATNSPPGVESKNDKKGRQSGTPGTLGGMVAKVQASYGAVTQSLEPLASALLKGRNVLDIGQQYETYQTNVLALEDSVKRTRTTMLAQMEEVQKGTENVSSLLSRALPAAGGGVIVLGLVVGLIISNQVSRSMRQLLEGIRSVEKGESKQINVHAGGEIAEIAEALNNTMGSLQGYLKSDSERHMTQENVIRFLDVVSQAADGDLTMKAPVTADVFGNIADAYNLMVDGLANLLVDVRKSANEVGEESRRLLGIFSEMERGSGLQAEQVQRATGYVDETSATTLEISQKSTEAEEVSSTVDRVTGEGNRLVRQNIDGMQVIRVTVQGINKKMKSLSERLMEIGTISQLISEVASRTTILAMNASIEAARAGAQGRGFLVIADEIKGLADKSAEATKQINGIIRAIQTEASEVTASLEEETRTVEAQTRLAQDTGEAFKEIEQGIGQSRNVVSEIYNVSQRQRGLTADAVTAMGEVSKLSSKAMNLVNNSSTITTGIHQMSELLLQSLSRFRIESIDTRDDEAISVEEYSQVSVGDSTFGFVEEAPVEGEGAG